MGTQAMASKTDGRQHSPVRSLARQGSFYKLTLNEVQNHFGEPLHRMNLDDLLKNIFAIDNSPFLLLDIESTATQCSSSGFGLSKKRVDEVWREIQQKKSNDGQSTNQERQPMLEEMTLEDFLMKAGIGNVDFPQGPHWFHQFNQISAVHQQKPHQNVEQMMGPYDRAYDPVPPVAEGQVGMISAMVGAVSDPQTPGRKRGAREYVEEKTVERQKRMIKNRESAARSRARKQEGLCLFRAYTNELENKISCLEEENERLRTQKELDTILHCARLPEPKHQLRRSSSARF